MKSLKRLGVSVTLLWHRSRKAGDLDNRSKVLYDALQGSIYTDDQQIAEDARKRSDTGSGSWQLMREPFQRLTNLTF